LRAAGRTRLSREANGVVVVLNRAIEGLADFGEVAGHGAEAFVDHAPEGGDLAGVIGEGFLTPAVGNRAQQGDQRG